MPTERAKVFYSYHVHDPDGHCVQSWTWWSDQPNGSGSDPRALAIAAASTLGGTVLGPVGYTHRRCLNPPIHPDIEERIVPKKKAEPAVEPVMEAYHLHTDESPFCRSFHASEDGETNRKRAANKQKTAGGEVIGPVDFKAVDCAYRFDKEQEAERLAASAELEDEDDEEVEEESGEVEEDEADDESVESDDTDDEDAEVEDDEESEEAEEESESEDDDEDEDESPEVVSEEDDEDDEDEEADEPEEDDEELDVADESEESESEDDNEDSDDDESEEESAPVAPPAKAAKTKAAKAASAASTTKPEATKPTKSKTTRTPGAEPEPIHVKAKAPVKKDDEVDLTKLECSGCGGSLDGHKCPSAAKRTGVKRKSAEEHPACPHCGGRVHWNNGGAIVNAECLMRQFYIETGEMSDPNARLPIFTAETAIALGKWAAAKKKAGTDLTYGKMDSAAGAATYSGIKGVAAKAAKAAAPGSKIEDIAATTTDDDDEEETPAPPKKLSKKEQRELAAKQAEEEAARKAEEDRKAKRALLSKKGKGKGK